MFFKKVINNKNDMLFIISILKIYQLTIFKKSDFF